MTTDIFANDGPSRRPSDGRIGALAAVTPIAMLGGWIAISGWGGTPLELFRGTAGIGLGAVAAGWIVGARVGGSIAGRLVGLVAYGLVGYLLLLPLNVVGATWEDVVAGRTSGDVELVAAAILYMLYGLVSAIYVSPYLLPFGAGWMATYLILHRASDR
jgi:hypothetical protein